VALPGRHRCAVALPRVQGVAERDAEGGTGCDRGEADRVAVPEGRDGHGADGTAGARRGVALPGMSGSLHRHRGHAARKWGTTAEMVAGRHERAHEPAGDVRGPAASATPEQADTFLARLGCSRAGTCTVTRVAVPRGSCRRARASRPSAPPRAPRQLPEVGSLAPVARLTK